MKIGTDYIKSSAVVKNTLSVGLVQAANYLIPIVIIPLVVRALGTEGFGKASYAQNIVSYLTILVNYGFEYSATQDVAVNRDNKEKLKSVFWTVMHFKALLLVASFAVLILLYATGGKVHEEPQLYLYAAIINIGVVLFPTWFFQGMEQMHKMALTNAAIKLLGAVLIVLLVKTADDYKIYILILSMSYVAVGAISFIYVIRHFGLRYKTKIERNKDVVKKGFPVFLNNIFATLYSIGGVTVLGCFASDSDVGIYSGAHKMAMAVVFITSTPMTMALFPDISRRFEKSKREGWRYFKKCLTLTGIISLCVSITTFLISPHAVKILLGDEFAASENIFKILSPLPFLITVASMFTIQGLYGLKLYKYAPYVGGTVGIFCTVCNFILIPKYGMYGAAVSYLLSEILEIILSGYFTISHSRKLYG